ncbi:MAG: hypothetical protein RIR79_1627 [Pseudomonadota bacterium]|jgi:hypothetical protein
MQPITIYFNEQSLQGELNSHQWQSGIEILCEALNIFFNLRNDGRIVFIDNQLNFEIEKVSLRNRVKDGYGKSKDKYLRFLSRINNIELNRELPCDVYWDKYIASGATLAVLQDSLVFSIEPSHVDWQNHCIPAIRYQIDDIKDILIGIPCDIKNIGTKQHCDDWETYIRDWGATVAPSSVLDEIHGHKIVMYPNVGHSPEHNPPHVHVLNKNGEGTFAKYRIEDFKCEKGPPVKGMEDWLKKYQSQLLRSWERCYQRGSTPYQLEEPEPKN